MLQLNVVMSEAFNEATQEFVVSEEVVLELEHSLVSLSKWESRFKKPFLGPQEKTREEIVAYIICMLLNPTISMDVIYALRPEHFEKINAYIEDKQTATTFNDPPSTGKNREIITSELIYYWMVTFNIPFECQYWPLNRLFTLIKICNVKNSKPKKMSASEIAARNRELNAQRRNQLKTQG